MGKTQSKEDYSDEDLIFPVLLVNETNGDLLKESIAAKNMRKVNHYVRRVDPESKDVLDGKFFVAAIQVESPQIFQLLLKKGHGHALKGDTRVLVEVGIRLMKDAEAKERIFKMLPLTKSANKQ